MRDYYCIYKYGYNVIYAVGETEEQCKQNYLNNIGEEYIERSFFECDKGDNVLIPCSAEVYNLVLEKGGQSIQDKLSFHGGYADIKITKYCIYQVGFGIIHAVGETIEQCKQNYLDEIGEEFDGSDSYFQCAVGDCVLLKCTDEVYNTVLEDGGDFGVGKIVVWDGCVRTSL